MKKIFNQKGSLLLEILLAVAVGAIIIGAVSGLVFVSLKSGQISGQKSAAVFLAEEGMEATQSISEADWHSIYLPPDGAGDPDAGKGDANPYYIYKNGFFWALGKVTLGDEGDIPIDGIIYTRKIYIENVTRDKTGERQICDGVGICAEEVNDPSTQKIKVAVSKIGGADVVLEEYLTRWKNNTFSQSDWSGGEGQTDFIDPSKYYDENGNIDNTSIPGSIKLKQ